MTIINHYKFGHVTIDGVIYEKDVIILAEEVIANWWRKSGHMLQIEDLTAVLNGSTEVLIVGQGAYSQMKIPKETRLALQNAGIELIALPSEKACRQYNELSGNRSTALALHLTC